MSNEIKLLKNNENKELTDLEWADEFYRFLLNDKKLNKTKAFSVVYYLQEYLPVIPDTIEKCSECGDLYDSKNSGYHSDYNLKFYCNACYPYELAEKEQAREEREYKRSLK